MSIRSEVLEHPNMRERKLVVHDEVVLHSNYDGAEDTSELSSRTRPAVFPTRHAQRPIPVVWFAHREAMTCCQRRRVALPATGSDELVGIRPALSLVAKGHEDLLMLACSFLVNAFS